MTSGQRQRCGCYTHTVTGLLRRVCPPHHSTGLRRGDPWPAPLDCGCDPARWTYCPDCGVQLDEEQRAAVAAFHRRCRAGAS